MPEHPVSIQFGFTLAFLEYLTYIYLKHGHGQALFVQCPFDKPGRQLVDLRIGGHGDHFHSLLFLREIGCAHCLSLRYMKRIKANGIAIGVHFLHQFIAIMYKRPANRTIYSVDGDIHKMICFVRTFQFPIPLLICIVHEGSV